MAARTGGMAALAALALALAATAADGATLRSPPAAAAGEAARALGPREELAAILRTRAKCTNCADLLADLGFSDYATRDPYPNYRATGGYDTVIATGVNCYVKFADDARFQSEGTIRYELQTLTATAAAAANNSDTYITHEGACAACSPLDQLAVYLAESDLAGPVRNCALKRLLSNSLGLQCLADLGFRDACLHIWNYNSAHSGKTCALPCAFSSSNNKESGGTNYCKPFSACLLWWTCDMNLLGCKNTINGEPACSNDTWEDGTYRLSPCKQCDECRSGPIFKKFSGRTRRNSGLPSAILRPPDQIAQIDHYYGIDLD